MRTSEDQIMGDMFAGRVPAWHKLGTVYPRDSGITAEQALVNMGGDFAIEKRPLLVQMADGGTFATGTYGLVRPATKHSPQEYLGQVSGDYGYAQNIDLARIIDRVAEATGWTFETAGVLGKGGRVFFTLDAGNVTIGGQDSRAYYYLNENRGDGRAANMGYSPVVIVCGNTLRLGIQDAMLNVQLFHNKDFHRELDWRTKLVAQLLEAQQRTHHRVDALTFKRIVDGQLDDLLTKIFPEPAESKAEKTLAGLRESGVLEDGKLDADTYVKLDDATRNAVRWREQTMRHRQAVKELVFKYNDQEAQDPRTRGTAFSVLMAVTDWADHSRSKEGSDSAMFGDKARIKMRAFEILEAVR